MSTFMFKSQSSGSSSSSSGGGTSLQWFEEALAPTWTLEFSEYSYWYEAAQTQYLYAALKVPSTYTAGNPITLKMSYYSPDGGGTGLLQTLATLIRVDTDAFSSTTNQRTSTNAAVTFTIPNRLLKVEFDLTSAGGQINSVAVAANDVIKIRLTRGSDSATSEIRALVYSSEVTFS